MIETVTMNKRNVERAPSLRFPGFKGEWSIQPLGRLAQFKNGKPHEEFVLSGGKYNLITLDSISIDGVLKKYHRTVDQNDDSLLKNDIVMVLSDIAHARLLGMCDLIPESGKYVLNQRMGRIRASTDCSPNFIAYQLKRNQEYFRKKGQGTSQKHIYEKDVATFLLNIPTLPEQQKIAAFLGAVDRKIQQLAQKQELLERYKKGVVQQLFSQELRFKRKDGGEFPEWEEKRLGDVADVIMGQSPASSSYNTTGEGLPLIQGNADIVGRVTSPRQWTSEPTKTCVAGDIILSVRAPVGAVSRSVHAACIGRGVCAIRAKCSGNAEYLYQLMIDFEPKWKGIEQGSTFTAISGEDVRDLEFSFPSLEEQTRIAGFLMALDAKVAGVAQAVAAAQKWKKGLLQQMFV
jgi:type I restriction enzyme S subunit